MKLRFVYISQNLSVMRQKILLETFKVIFLSSILFLGSMALIHAL